MGGGGEKNVYPTHIGAPSPQSSVLRSRGGVKQRARDPQTRGKDCPREAILESVSGIDRTGRRRTFGANVKEGRGKEVVRKNSQ